MRLLSFDIEISDVFDLKPGEDLDRYAPFHIAVASTVIDGGEERLWYSAGSDQKPSANMTAAKARELLAYLHDMQTSGYMVCAWNGLQFDLRWIGHVADDAALAARVALKTYDPMFQFFNRRGFPVSLEAVARGMRIPQRKVMTAADAPREWRAGNYQAVMDYVLGDSQITNRIVKAIADRGEVRWITAKGQARTEPMPRLKPVETVLADPEPDQSWMDHPIPRSTFSQWFPANL